jgi:DNA-directed RNA polymerase subunit RPC12/RpoP
MKILIPGHIPKYRYIGVCSHCGTKIALTDAEQKEAMVESLDGCANVRCPTEGCLYRIYTYPERTL